MEFKWEPGFTISVREECDAVVISANKAGLISLAASLMTLAQEKGTSHFHLDQYNSLEDGSLELIVDKIDEENSQENE